VPRLPGTLREAEYILSLVPDGSSMKAIGFAASRTLAMSAELSQYRIVHFATHGLMNSDHAELSGILLSMLDEHGRAQNGFLRLRDIYNLDLRADLVVLSACNTALGKEIKGEGVVGLARGFMYSGAKRVLASLWKVDDEATGELMKRVYQGMLAGSLSPAAALREAQVSMWREKQWSAPFYWSAFTLQGDWR
jgi:CHAT domain-containing protein